MEWLHSTYFSVDPSYTPFAPAHTPCRLFFQPKLAVLSNTCVRSMSDMMHFAFVFSIILIFYGVWGYTWFGGQVRNRACTHWRYRGILTTCCLTVTSFH